MDKPIGNVVVKQTPYQFEGYKFALYLYFYKPIDEKVFGNVLENKLFETGLHDISVMEVKKSEQKFPNDNYWEAYRQVEKGKVEIPKEKYVVYILSKEEQETEDLENDIEEVLKEEGFISAKPLFQVELVKIKKFPFEKDITTKIPITKSMLEKVIKDG